MRLCSSCGSSYEDYGQKANLCKPCRRQYDRDYHKGRSQEVKDRKRDLQKIRRVENRKYLYEYLSKNPCVVCGEADPVVLEFDHLDQSQKFKALSVMVEYSLKTIQKEIEKCRVLCANCHRRHTAGQCGWYQDFI